MSTVLDRIKAYKLKEIATRKAALPQDALIAQAASAPPVRPFANALRTAAETGFALIAEIKKASPSKGLIRADFDPPAIAEAYAAGGATCLSVLTDAPSFQGEERFLSEARAACALPVLRKDFLYDPWQVAEARAIGADCILVIMASVTDDEAQTLVRAAFDWEMDVLLEVHDRRELDRALALDAGRAIVGINNRNLKTFETSLDVTRDLAPLVPPGRLVVAESGIAGPEDLAELAGHGARAFLIGESLMRQADVAAATRRMLSAAQARPLS